VSQRRVSLLRHGHALAFAEAGDFDRALDARGQREAIDAAHRLATLDEPDVILVSSARRTRETAATVLAELARPLGDMRLEPALYLADLATLQSTIAKLADTQRHALLIGHNPGLSDLAFEWLTGEIGAPPFNGLATGGLCSVLFEADRWRDVGAENIVASSYHSL